MITNKKTFLKEVKKDFPMFIDDKAIINEAIEKLYINDGLQVEFSYKNRIKLYDFILLKNGKYRFSK